MRNQRGQNIYEQARACVRVTFGASRRTNKSAQKCSKCMRACLQCLDTGLHRLGVWLRPTELATLFAAVDEDGGGDVDFDEFEAFWLKW